MSTLPPSLRIWPLLWTSIPVTLHSAVFAPVYTLSCKLHLTSCIFFKKSSFVLSATTSESNCHNRYLVVYTRFSHFVFVSLWIFCSLLTCSKVVIKVVINTLLRFGCISKGCREFSSTPFMSSLQNTLVCSSQVTATLRHVELAMPEDLRWDKVCIAWVCFSRLRC